MTENIDRDSDFAEGADPADYNVGPVSAFLEGASAEEVQRVKDAELADSGRTTVLAAADARLAALADSDGPEPSEEPDGGTPTPVNTQDPEDHGYIRADPRAEGADPIGLETTENAADLATRYVDPTEGQSVAADQEGAPEALSAQVRESERLGYLAPEQNPAKPEKPDYTQSSSTVMNQV